MYALFIDPDGKDFQIRRLLCSLPPRNQVEALAMPWTDNFAQVINLSLAQRFTIVRTGVSYSK